MAEQVNCMKFSELKELVAALAANDKVTDETKIFLDTGWDSLQEILPGSVSLASAKPFQVQDELTKEFFGGYVLTEKSAKFDVSNAAEDVIVIKNLY
ncbi:hypothetical protein [Enterococcus sp. DIV0876]|uniref:hypothetical protein n=1 Tax=Enterococcus sp. DIV0876 TaxID=2774633 RepID=UPI003D2F9E97